MRDFAVVDGNQAAEIDFCFDYSVNTQNFSSGFQYLSNSISFRENQAF